MVGAAEVEDRDHGGEVKVAGDNSEFLCFLVGTIKEKWP